jgi:general secretion pathway protein E/type IV pilus assembly protein PilB
MMAHKATSREILRAAMGKGFKTLADDGARRVLDGSTSLDELMRVVDMTERM